MECPLQGGNAAADLTVGFCAGTLDAATQEAFERHLEHCSKCSALVLAQRNVWNALDHLTPARISPDFDEQVFLRIARENALWAQVQPSWSWRRTVPVAAACVALLTAFLLKTPQPPAVSPTSPPQAIQIEQVEHALDDMDMLKQMGFESVGETNGVQPI